MSITVTKQDLLEQDLFGIMQTCITQAYSPHGTIIYLLLQSINKNNKSIWLIGPVI